MILIGFILSMIGLLADLIAGNRKLIEDVLYRVKSIDIDKNESEDKKKNHFT